MTSIRTVMLRVMRVFFPQVLLTCVMAGPAVAQSQLLTDSDIRARFSIIAVMVAVLLVTGVFFAWRRTSASRGQALKAAAWMAFGVLVWMFVTGMAAALKLLRFDTLPPTMAIVFVLTLVLSVGLGRSRVGARLAMLPIAVLVGAQGFRLPLELAMHRAYEHGIMPVQMSYSGLNFDIVTGILAIVVAVLVAMGIAGVRTVRIWNLLGTALLINVLVIAWLSAPTPLRVFKNDPSNAWIAGLPYIWLPTVMVAFAILGHVVLFRRLADRV